MPTDTARPAEAAGKPAKVKARGKGGREGSVEKRLPAAAAAWEKLPECRVSSVHREWCLAIFGGLPLPSTPPPPEIISLLQKLATQRPDVLEFIKKNLPKLMKQLKMAKKPPKQAKLMNPAEIKKLLRQLLLHAKKHRAETLRRKRMETREALAKIEKTAKETLAPKHAAHKTTLRKVRMAVSETLKPMAGRRVKA